MHLLLPLASLLGIEFDELADRIKRNALAYGAVAALLVIALVFLLVALSNWLSVLWGPVLGPLALAGFALLLALIVYGSIAITHRAEKRRSHQRQATAQRTALVTTAAASALPLLLRSRLLRKVGLPLGGVLAAVFLLSRDNDGPPER